MKRFLQRTLVLVLLLVLTPFFAFAQDHQITGTVTDAETGTPLPGVNVVVKGTATGTATGTDGMYELAVADPNAMLVFSFVGYDAKEVPIDGRTTIDVALAPSVVRGEEVVVTALGIEQQARSLSYSVAEVEASDLVQANAPTLATALYGKIAGLNISQNASGGGISLTIRGVRSITGNSRPLIVVDGSPFTIRTRDTVRSDGRSTAIPVRR